MARAIWQKTVIDNTGAPSNGAQVTVTIQGGGAATIFSAQAGGSARTNPFTTGSDGIARFYAARGYYNVTIFKEGQTVTFPWNNLGDKNLFDDLGTAGFANLTTSTTDATAGRVFKVGDNVGITFGSNANGNFTRFPDGTLICYFLTSANFAEIQAGALKEFSFSFPSSFIDNPATTASGFITNGVGSFTFIPLAPAFQSSWGFGFRNTSSSGVTVIGKLSLMAIGRWK
jgi:hypothetical protein